MSRTNCLCLTACLLLAALAGCTDPSEPQITTPYSDPNDHTTTSVVTNLVQIETGGTMDAPASWVRVFISVTDQQGLPLQSLNRFNFLVAESTAAGEVQISSENLTSKSVAEYGRSTASSLVMDYSDYMPGNVKTDMENAVKAFITLMQSGDVAEIVKFALYPEIVQAFTSNKDDLTLAVERTWGGAGGGSALIDAVYMAMTDAATRDELSAVYAMALGWDDSSQHTMAEVRALSDSTLTPCYAFGMGDGDTTNLSEMAEATGGRFFYVPALEDPTRIYEILSGMLKKSYVLEWDIQSAPGSGVHISITTEYTCANGTLRSTATGFFIAP